MTQKLKQRISEIRRRSEHGGEGYWMPGGRNKTLAAIDIGVLLERVDTLEDWIKAEADRTDSCTFALFVEVCEGCRRERLLSLHNAGGMASGADGPLMPSERKA